MITKDTENVKYESVKDILVDLTNYAIKHYIMDYESIEVIDENKR